MGLKSVILQSIANHKLAGYIKVQVIASNCANEHGSCSTNVPIWTKMVCVRSKPIASNDVVQHTYTVYSIHTHTYTDTHTDADTGGDPAQRRGGT